MFAIITFCILQVYQKHVESINTQYSIVVIKQIIYYVFENPRLIDSVQKNVKREEVFLPRAQEKVFKSVALYLFQENYLPYIETPQINRL